VALGAVASARPFAIRDDRSFVIAEGMLEIVVALLLTGVQRAHSSTHDPLSMIAAAHGPASFDVGHRASPIRQRAVSALDDHAPGLDAVGRARFPPNCSVRRGRCARPSKRGRDGRRGGAERTDPYIAGRSRSRHV